MPRLANLWWNGIFWRRSPVDECGTEARDGGRVASTPLDRAAVRAAPDQPFRPLLSADRRECADAGIDGAHRRDVPGLPALRLAADDTAPAPVGPSSWSKPGCPVDAQDRAACDLPEAQHQRPASRAPGVSLFAT